MTYTRKQLVTCISIVVRTRSEPTCLEQLLINVYPVPSSGHRLSWLCYFPNRALLHPHFECPRLCNHSPSSRLSVTPGIRLRFHPPPRATPAATPRQDYSTSSGYRRKYLYFHLLDRRHHIARYACRSTVRPRLRAERAMDDNVQDEERGAYPEDSAIISMLRVPELAGYGVAVCGQVARCKNL